MIKLNNASMVKRILIGQKINGIASTAFQVNKNSISNLEINLLILLENKNLLFSCDFKKGFFENEYGDVFYDYIIEENITNSKFEKSIIKFNTSEIIQIDVYGKDFNDKEFVEFPELHKKINGIKRTDDLFVIYCKDGEQLIFVFHPFFPSIEVYFKENGIKIFWSQYGEKYKLHHSIK